MPILTYNLLREVLEKYKRPVSTKELMDHIASKSPKTLDSILSDILLLERKGFVKREFDKKINSFVWDVVKPELSKEEMLEKYPELYSGSLYGNEPINGIEKIKKKKNE
jgi:DNA-binding HxlR family transcriptional regulator